MCQYVFDVRSYGDFKFKKLKILRDYNVLVDKCYNSAINIF